MTPEQEKFDKIRENVAKRLAALQINAFEAARRAGLSRDFVNSLLHGRKKSIRTEGLLRLADALRCDPSWLIGDTVEISKQQSEPHEKVLIEGIAAVGTWRDPDFSTEFVIGDGIEGSLLPPDARYLAADQFDLLIGDAHLDRVSKPGQFARCIRPSAADHSVSDRMLHVIRREKAGLFETTIRIYFKDRIGRNEVYGFLTNDAVMIAKLHDDPIDTSRAEVIGYLLFVYGYPPRL